MIVVTNPVALAHAMGNPAGIRTRDGVLVGWPEHLRFPTQAEVDQYESDYAALPPSDVDRWDALEVLRTRSDLLGGTPITVSDIETKNQQHFGRCQP